MGKKKPFTDQHIVPVSYLRRFAKKGNSAEIIGVISKNGKHFTSSINDVGYIKNYYDVSFRDDKKHWEKYFNNELESISRKPIDNFLTKVTLARENAEIFSDDDKRILSRFIIIQLLRVPAFIDEQISSSEAIIKRKKLQLLEQYDFSEQQKEIIRQFSFSDDQKKDNLLSNITDKQKLDRYCNILISKPWVVYYNDTALPFITSDNPVVMTNISSLSTSRKDNGIGNECTIIYFPLNKNIAIGIYPYWFHDYIKEYEGKITYLSKQDIRMIYKMNSSICNQCYNHVFLSLDHYYKLFDEKRKE